MMSRRTEISILVGLLVLLVALFYFNNRSQDPGIPGVLAADGKFQPLDVHEPQLRLDLLANLQKLAYSGSHRNIFVAAPRRNHNFLDFAAAYNFFALGQRLQPLVAVNGWAHWPVWLREDCWQHFSWVVHLKAST